MFILRWFLCKTPIMKILITILLSVTICNLFAQENSHPNIFIITTDGFRWQEVFNGADSSIITNKKFVQDTTLMKQLYWDITPEARRKKLLPFFWNVIATQGQLYGNRHLQNKVDVQNSYKISYPGYSELLTGYADPFPYLNVAMRNRRVSILEYLNNQPEYKNKVAAFTSWRLFPFILNNKRNRMMINSGYQLNHSDSSTATQLTNAVQQQTAGTGNTREDMLTFSMAKAHIENNHPKVVFISLGQTDEYAHHGRYDLYLQQAHAIDVMLAELWYYVQTDPFYRNNTSFIITTDHGRGNKPNSWGKHNAFVKGSGEIWLAMLGKNIAGVGEVNIPQRIFQSQIAATVAQLTGHQFLASHPVAKAVNFLTTSLQNRVATQAASAVVVQQDETLK